MTFQIWHYEPLAANDRDPQNFFGSREYLQGGWEVPKRRALDAQARVNRIVMQHGVTDQVQFGGVVIKYPWLQRSVRKSDGSLVPEPAFGFDETIHGEAMRRVVESTAEVDFIHLFDPRVASLCVRQLLRAGMGVCIYTGGPTPEPTPKAINDFGQFMRTCEVTVGARRYAPIWGGDATAYPDNVQDFVATREALVQLGVDRSNFWVEGLPVLGSTLDVAACTAMTTDKGWRDVGRRVGIGMRKCKCGMLFEGDRFADVCEASAPGGERLAFAAVNCNLESEANLVSLVRTAAGLEVLAGGVPA